MTTTINLYSLQPPLLHLVVAEADEMHGWAKDFSDDTIEIVFLDGTRLSSFRGFFDEIATQFKFPTYFGRNFNALNDCLTDLEWVPVTTYAIIVTDAELLLAAETEEDRTALFQLFERVADGWNRPFEPNEMWGRSGRPFHVVFGASKKKAPIVQEALERAGVSFGIADDF